MDCRARTDRTHSTQEHIVEDSMCLAEAWVLCAGSNGGLKWLAQMVRAI